MTDYAFLSYAHSDDHFLDGGISWLRDRLEISVQAISGHPFTIFQDKDGIEFGQHWPKRLDDALKSARFLIPILTPSYFASPSCRAEALKFLEYESAAKRDDLILPIYLISVAAFEHDKLRRNDDLAARLYERQHRDWRFCVPDIRDAEGIKNYIVALAKEIDTSAKRRMSTVDEESSVDDSTDEGDLATENETHPRGVPQQSAKERFQEVNEIIRKSKSFITISRHHTFIEHNATDVCRNCWNMLNHLYNESRRYKLDQTFIWSIDMGSRLVEEPDAFASYVNISQLAVNLCSFSMFDTATDHGDVEHSKLAARARIPDTQRRGDRWHWLAERAVVIVQNARREEFDDLYPDDKVNLHSIRLKDIGVSTEHVLPSIMPSIWAHQLTELYDRDIEASDATFTIFLGEEAEEDTSKVRETIHYLAHAFVPEGFVDEVTGHTWFTRSIELQSPGRSYDEAAQIMELAAQYRLGKCGQDEIENGATAVAYLGNLGFQILLLPDFVRLFTRSI